MYSLFTTHTCTQNPIHSITKILYFHHPCVGLKGMAPVTHPPPPRNSPRNDTKEILPQISVYPWVPSTLPSTIKLSAILKLFGLSRESLNLPVICSPSVNTAVCLVTLLRGLIALLLYTCVCICVCVGGGVSVCLSKNIIQNVISTNFMYTQLDILVYYTDA